MKFNSVIVALFAASSVSAAAIRLDSRQTGLEIRQNNNNNNQNNGQNQNKNQGNQNQGNQNQGNQNQGNQGNQNQNQGNNGNAKANNGNANANNNGNAANNANANNNGNANAGNGNANAGGAAGDAAGGAADFGTCTPKMDFQLGRAGRKATEGTFLPSDPAIAANQSDALNPNIITNRICDDLTNVCGANAAAKALCKQAQATIQSLGTKDASTADAFNQALGF
ncbi:hypothetical protein PG994_011996 [Apiospora phragmitis]|uniref:Uncharacterized protein n=1 Tax=Apiospora phragmitis TaxID=2905665 RepID=A0ABR1TUE2_9PEZI